MVMPGETVATGAPLPYDGAQPQVMQSAAGWYIGYLDNNGFPYTRESGYYEESEAHAHLTHGTWSR